MKIILGLLVGVACLILIGPAYFWVYRLEQSDFSSLSQQQWLELSDFLSNTLAPSFAFLSVIALSMTLVIQNRQVSQAGKATEAGALLHMVEKLEVEIVNALKSHVLRVTSIDRKVTAYHLVMDSYFVTWREEMLSFDEGVNMAANGTKGWQEKQRLCFALHEVAMSFSLLTSSVLRYEDLSGDTNLRFYYSKKFNVAFSRMDEYGYLDGVLQHPFDDK